MRDPARAVDLLRLVLAPEMFAKLDASSVEVQPGSWVDEDLEEEHSDLLLATQYDGQPTLIYVLLEHKSTVEPWVFMQMLGYMVAIWNEHHAASPTTPPPPILPVLVSHAEGGWTGPVRLAELFGAVVTTHPEWAPFIPDFDVVHEDLHQRDDASLRDANLHPGVVMALVALRDARRADILATLRRYMAELRAVAELRETLALFRQLVKYLAQVVPELPLAEFVPYWSMRRPRRRRSCPHSPKNGSTKASQGAKPVGSARCCVASSSSGSSRR